MYIYSILNITGAIEAKSLGALLCLTNFTCGKSKEIFFHRENHVNNPVKFIWQPFIKSYILTEHFIRNICPPAHTHALQPLSSTKHFCWLLCVKIPLGLDDLKYSDIKKKPLSLWARSSHHPDVWTLTEDLDSLIYDYANIKVRNLPWMLELNPVCLMQFSSQQQLSYTHVLHSHL